MSKRQTTHVRETAETKYDVKTPKEAARRLAQLAKEIAKKHPKPKETSTETLRRLRGPCR